jgi:hypothetical protein
MWFIVLIIFIAMFLGTEKWICSFPLPIVARVDSSEKVNTDDCYVCLFLP